MPIQIAKPIKIAIALIVIIFTLFIIGSVKDVPIYEVRKEVKL